MYQRRLGIIIQLRYGKEKRQGNETMDGWKERQTRQIGRPGERKKDDCGCNHRQLKVVSHELLGVAVTRDHLSVISTLFSFLDFC